MKKLLFTSLFACLFGAFLSAQFSDATLLFTDGTKKEGFADIPDNPYDGSIKFKSSIDGKLEIIPSKLISSVKYVTKIGETLIFERLRIANIHVKKDGTVKLKLENKDSWLFLASNHQKLNYYKFARGYDIDKKGQFYFIYSQGSFSPTTPFFKKPSEINAIGLYAPLTNILRNLKGYFKDAPHLVKKIENNEIDWYDSDKLYKEYISY